MEKVVQPLGVYGSITAPPSKSAMQRACAAALLRTGKTILTNPGVSADDEAALKIIESLGAVVQKNAAQVTITGNGNIAPGDGQFTCGESGLSVRMFTPVAATSAQPFVINGTGSLLQRPLHFFEEVLPQVGVKCTSNEGKLPLHIQGPLHPQNITVDGSLSSQFLTGLLFAYSAAGAKDVTITVTNLQSKPYIDLTLQVMRDFGLRTPVNHDYKAFQFNTDAVSSAPADLHYTVEGDWSGGAFLLVAGAIAGDLVVNGLALNSTQADKAAMQALEIAGAQMQLSQQSIYVKKSALQSFSFDATHCPDLFPPLVVLAAYCAGTSVIKGVHRLTHKESNRALTLQQEFGKMGIRILLDGDNMRVDGGKIQAATVSSHHDHRIAMACAVAALCAEGAVTIQGAEAVAKSYPQFWEHLSAITQK